MTDQEALIEHIMTLEGDELDVALRKLGFDPAQLLSGFKSALAGDKTVPRKPTEAMLEAARQWSDKALGRPVGNGGATGCWQAMFDAVKPDMFKRAQLAQATADAEAAIMEWCANTAARLSEDAAAHIRRSWELEKYQEMYTGQEEATAALSEVRS